MTEIPDSAAYSLRHLGYRYPLEWLQDTSDIDSWIQSFLSGKPAGTARETSAPRILKKDQEADIAKVLANPAMRRHYRFIIAEEEGIDNARRLAARFFMAFYRLTLKETEKGVVAARPPRWVVVDNDPKQELSLGNCGALFLDNYSYNSTSLKGEKVRDFMTSQAFPIFLICAGSDPWTIIREKLNCSFDAYAFLKTTLSRTL